MPQSSKSYWIVDADGDWSTPGNWYTDTGGGYQHLVPGSGNDVSLTPDDPTTGMTGGTNAFTVTFNTTDTIASLATPSFATLDMTGGALTVTGTMALGGALTMATGTMLAVSGAYTQGTGVVSGTGTMTLAGGASFSLGYAVLTGAGKTMIQGASTISATSLDLDAGRSLENQGTVTWTSGYITLGYNHNASTGTGGTTLKNDAGATFDIEGGDVLSVVAGTNSFVNAGLLERLTDTGSTQIRAAFTNTGTVLIQAGTLDFSGETAPSSTKGQITNNGFVTVGINGTLLAGGQYTYNNREIDQYGQVQLGDGSGLSSTLINNRGTIYNLYGDVGIAAGPGFDFTPSLSIQNNGGTLTKASGSGTSVIAPAWLGSAGTIKVQAGRLEFDGGGSLFAETIVGAGTFAIGGGGSTTINTGTITTGGFVISGTGTTVSLGNSLRYAGTFQELDTSVLKLNGYTLTVTGSATFAGTNTVSAIGNVTIGGGGGVNVTNVTTVANLLIGAGTRFVNNGTTTQNGNLTIGDRGPSAAKVVNAAGATYAINGNYAIGADARGVFQNFGTLAKTAGTAVSTVAASLFGSSAAPGQIRVDTGTLELDGASNALIAQTITGAGTFAVGGSSYTVIGAGTTIGTNAFRVSAFSLGGTGSTVALAEDLIYRGAFSEFNGTTLNLGSHTLTLAATANFAGTSGAPKGIAITGTGTLALSGTTTITSANILAGVQVDNTGSVTLSRVLGLGDSTNQAATIMNAAGATWTLANGGVIAGTSAARFDNAGTLIKATGSGHALVNAAIINSSAGTGTIEAGAGIFELGGTIGGAQALKADAGATLVLDKGTGTGAAFAFNGANATLQLNDAQDYMGTVANFAGGQTMDLRSIGYGGATPSYDTSSGLLTVTDGSHTANLRMLGSYTSANFHAADDQHGGTVITFAALS